MVRAEIEKKLGEFLTMLVPPGSGPEARRETMGAVAAVLGMYLAGDLAKLGRRQYVQSVLKMIEIIQGVAETSAIQLRGHAPRSDRKPPPIITAATAGTPPYDMHDPDGEVGILLSAMGARIHINEMEWWQLPGWPQALVRVTAEGIEVKVPPSEESDEHVGSSWKIVRVDS